MIVVTLVCCYFGAWEATKKQGVDDVINYTEEILPDTETTYDVSFSMEYHPSQPLVVRVDRILFEPHRTRCYYYFWFFGYVAKLPYEREIS